MAWARRICDGSVDRCENSLDRRIHFHVEMMTIQTSVVADILFVGVYQFSLINTEDVIIRMKISTKGEKR